MEYLAYLLTEMICLYNILCYTSPNSYQLYTPLIDRGGHCCLCHISVNMMYYMYYINSLNNTNPLLYSYLEMLYLLHVPTMTYLLLYHSYISIYYIFGSLLFYFYLELLSNLSQNLNCYGDVYMKYSIVLRLVLCMNILNLYTSIEAKLTFFTFLEY